MIPILAAVSVAGSFPYPPTQIGAGARFHPRPAAHAAGVGCSAQARWHAAHLELFARNRVIIVPAGIHHRCLRTRWPVGIVEARGRRTLGDFFRVWGQPLSATRLAGFRTTRRRPVRAYVAGRRWRGSLGAIPLRRHAQVVIELGRFIRPKPDFLFPRGL